jgi:hypothetical protein
MKTLLPYAIQLIAAALILGAAVLLATRLPPIAVNISIIARDITVSGDY